jgi:hypothetical protein
MAPRGPGRDALRLLKRVIPDGREVHDPEADEFLDAELYTVSCASDPEQLVRGVDLWVEFKGEFLTPAMG